MGRGKKKAQKKRKQGNKSKKTLQPEVASRKGSK